MNKINLYQRPAAELISIILVSYESLLHDLVYNRPKGTEAAISSTWNIKLIRVKNYSLYIENYSIWDYEG